MGVVRWCVASAGDRDRGMATGGPPLLGAGGGRDDDDDSAASKSGASAGFSPLMVAAAADKRDLRRSRADELLGEDDMRGELLGAIPAARCSFLDCKIFNAAFNSFAPPVKLAACSPLR